MHTVSLFPHLFDYQMLGIFALRVTLGFIFLRFWYLKFTHGRAGLSHFFSNISLRPTSSFRFLIPTALGIAGALLVAGLYTQGAAAVAGTLVTIAAFFKGRDSSSHPDNTIEFYIILAAASFALLFLGAGAYAVDLPL